MIRGLSREREIASQSCQTGPDMLADYIHKRDWAAMATIVEFTQRDVPPVLASTDSLLYLRLRNLVSMFYIRVGASFNLEKIQALANSTSITSTN